MSRESELKSLIDLKAKLTEVESAQNEVYRDNENLSRMKRESENVTLAMPVKPKLDNSESSRYFNKHSGASVKRYKPFVWFVFILFSIIILAGGYQLFELAQVNWNTMHTAFGKWLMEHGGALDTSDKVLMYLATAALAIINLVVCGIASKE